LRARVKATKGGFWKAVPPKLLEWQGLLASATNKLHAFLSMEDDERGCKIERVEGNVTWLQDFKAAYEACMGHGTFVSDTATFHAFGYRISESRENVCKSCKQLAKSRSGRCCENYSNADRGKKVVIHGMRCSTLVSVTQSKSEGRFRRELEDATGLLFPSVRPHWMCNAATHMPMELDMYNEGYATAVEYDGPQHREFPNAYHRSRKEFEEQTARDRLKDRLCTEHGIELFRVPAGTFEEDKDWVKKVCKAVNNKYK
jgi:hypothetical protein